MRYKKTVLGDRPAAYWRLDETGSITAADETGHGHSGSYQGSYLQDANPLIGTGTSVGLTGGYIDVGGWDWDPGDALTLEAWIESDSTGSQYIISDRSGTSWSHQLRIDGGVLEFWIAGGNGEVSAEWSGFSTNTLYHVVGTYDGATMRLFVNGEEKASASQTGKNNTDYGTFIGAASGGSSAFSGRLDEIAVYEHALTAFQVRRHYWSGQGYVEYPLEVRTSTPVAYWRLDEAGSTTAADETGNGHSGSYQGSYAQEAAPLIATGTAVSFTGGYIDVGGWDWDPGDALTLEAWIESDSTGSQYIISDRSGTSWSHQLRIDGGVLEFWIAGGNGEVSAEWSGFSTNTLYHVVGTYDGATMRLFVNGEEKASASQTGKNNTNNGTFIGAASGGSSAFSGRLDEVAVYERALTAMEVRRHHLVGQDQFGHPLSVLAQAPIGYWRLEELSGTTATDSSTVANDGSYNNATLGEPALIQNGQSVAFDASLPTDVEIPYSAVYDTSRITISFWLKWTANTGSYGGIVMRGSGSKSGSPWIIRENSGNIEMQAKGGAGVTCTIPGSEVPFDTALHIAFVFDAASLRAFVNGKQVASTGHNTSLATGNFPLTFGKDREDTSRALDGWLDEVAIFDRALSENAIARLYATGHYDVTPIDTFKIQGTTTVDGSAVEWTVRAYTWADGAFRAETKSDPADGAYAITGLTADSDVMVVTKPNAGERPLAHGPITPVAE